jgi:hypothetical protein
MQHSYRKPINPELRIVWLWLFALLALSLVPWFYLFGLTGMIGDSGNPLSISDYLFLAWIWTYPITLLIALILRRRLPLLILLPVLDGASLIGVMGRVR